MREPLMGAAIGRKGVGKTFQTLQLIDSYLKGNPTKGVKARRVLILDANDEFSQFRAIDIKDIPDFCNPK